MNHPVAIAEILVDYDTRDVGIQFDNGTCYVLPAAAAESLGRGLLKAAQLDSPRSATPSHARWA